jgi:hypothetical protein
MLRDWRKIVVVLALLIVVVGALMPDACADDSTTLAPTSATLSTHHTGDRPFGCQHEEDCFCCAHIAPMVRFEFYPPVYVAVAEQQPCVSSVKQVPSVPYHPPKP